MAGAQAAILDVRSKLHFENGKAAEEELGAHSSQKCIQALGCLYMNFLYLLSEALWRYELLFYVFYHPQQNSLFTFIGASVWAILFHEFILCNQMC